jgi:hypothetical protein
MTRAGNVSQPSDVLTVRTTAAVAFDSLGLDRSGER